MGFGFGGTILMVIYKIDLGLWSQNAAYGIPMVVLDCVIAERPP